MKNLSFAATVLAATTILSAPALAQEAATAAPTQPAAAAPAAAANQDVVATLQADGRFTTLLRAVEAAGLTQTLKSAPAITVLAPTDEAFAALPSGTVDELLKPEKADDLRKLLLGPSSTPT